MARAMGAHRNFSREGQGTDDMTSAGARAYNGGLGAEPPAGSRSGAPGQRVRGTKPPEAEHFQAFAHLKKCKNIAVMSICQDCPKYGTNNSKQTQPSPVAHTIVPPFCLGAVLHFLYGDSQRNVFLL